MQPNGEAHPTIPTSPSLCLLLEYLAGFYKILLWVGTPFISADAIVTGHVLSAFLPLQS